VSRNTISDRLSWISSLAGVRAIAVIMVVLSHDTLINQYFFSSPRLHVGGIAVGVFFILSGFLAYYILNKDFITFGSINYNNYIFRRILRIWPAYFVVIFLILIFSFLTNYYNKLAFEPDIYSLITF